MMLFPQTPAPLSARLDQFTTAAAIKSVLPYTRELERSEIDVEVTGGAVRLTGKAPCDAAIKKAIEIVAFFTSKPVFSSILPTARPRSWLERYLKTKRNF